MKKIMLLLTIICASVLNGMELEPVGMESLSPEVKVMIIQALNANDRSLGDAKNLINTINAIKAMSEVNWELNEIVNDMYGDPVRFRKLIRILVEKFPNFTTKEIAKKFGTEVAKNYIDLSGRLKNAFLVYFNNSEAKYIKDSIENLVTKGADVNFTREGNITILNDIFTFKGPYQGTLKMLEQYKQVLQKMLQYGATAKDRDIGFLNNIQVNLNENDPDFLARKNKIKEIYNMLRDEIVKRQQQ